MEIIQSQPATAPFTERTIADLVSEDFRRGIVFKQFGIDFCCGGGKTVADVCTARGIAPETLFQALVSAHPASGRSVPSQAGSWSPAFLADYIVNEHHAWVRERIPVLKAFTKRVAAVHGHHYTELAEIRDVFSDLADELEAHMEDEEQRVFPIISDGVAAEDLSELIAELEAEHEAAGGAMARLRELTNDFTPPEGACNTFRAAYAGLKDFEEDLHAHVHLENNVLFKQIQSPSAAKQ